MNNLLYIVCYKSDKTMEEYEILIIDNNNEEWSEYLRADSILEAINDYYASFGYAKIISIKINE